MLVPTPSKVAPRGAGSPGQTRMWFLSVVGAFGHSGVQG